MSSITKRNAHPIAGAFVFLLLGIFAVFSTMMIAMSAQVYRQTTNRTNMHNDRRIVDHYLMNTIHAADQSGMISVRDINGESMLVLTWPITGDEEELLEDSEEAMDESYKTLIYCWNGVLYELLLSDEYDFEPGDGEAICKLQSAAFTLNQNVLSIEVKEENQESRTLHIKLFTSLNEEVAS